MPTYNMPVIRPDDYDTFRRIKNADFPSTYNEWFDFAAQEGANKRAKSYVVAECEINSDEFARYCASSGSKPDFHTLEIFAFQKAGAKK